MEDSRVVVSSKWNSWRFLFDDEQELPINYLEEGAAFERDATLKPRYFAGIDWGHAHQRACAHQRQRLAKLALGEAA